VRARRESSTNSILASLEVVAAAVSHGCLFGFLFTWIIFPFENIGGFGHFFMMEMAFQNLFTVKRSEREAYEEGSKQGKGSKGKGNWGKAEMKRRRSGESWSRYLQLTARCRAVPVRL